MSSFIFVTGGVVSSLGKGITVASIGKMMKSRGLSVAIMKLDPYLNVDPGTMSPYQHGEVFVTVDGSETDLDLGHYERFIDVELTSMSNVTAGQIYSEVISNERKGKYLGGTIQTVPHVTDAIRSRLLRLSDESKSDVVIVEVGGTIGDIEGQPFIEAIRQMRRIVGQESTFYIHITLLPYLNSTDELKTKPTQHSVQELRGMGVMPDAILCRADIDIAESVKNKIALYCDVGQDAVISLPTLDNIYKVPIHLENQGLGKIIAEKFNFPNISIDLTEWEKITSSDTTNWPEITICIVGKYVELRDSYMSVIEAINHSAMFHKLVVKIKWIAAEDIEREDTDIIDLFGDVNGFIVPGGFDSRGIEGMIITAKYARENKIPYLGLCLGMQIMVIEFTRNVLGIKDANSIEMAEDTNDPVISFMEGQEDLKSTGGTMRLGSYDCKLRTGTIARKAYGIELVSERHRHRYELNNIYRERLEVTGLVSSGTSPDDSLVEIVEVKEHPFMLGSQFHPEFGSRPERPHPLFSEFIRVSNNTVLEGEQRILFD
ncbi:MAG: CTP synthetase [Chloroflexi bacterium]|nr:CTP synthetase [Chloroflexota bacterium]